MNIFLKKKGREEDDKFFKGLENFALGLIFKTRRFRRMKGDHRER